MTEQDALVEKLRGMTGWPADFAATPYGAEPCDIAIVGAGHAGIEAALAVSKLGLRTTLFSLNLDSVGNMPCNPSIGGTAKGQLVREIDALGGAIGRLADAAAIQYRMLNATKGPAVRSPRAQIDRRLYQELAKHLLENTEGVHLRQAEIVAVLSEPVVRKSAADQPAKMPPSGAKTPEMPSSVEARYEVRGVLTRSGAWHPCRKVILATGTFMESRIITGEVSIDSGPDNLFPSHGLAASLAAHGLKLQRFKTGTPVRINARSIDFSRLEIQEGDAEQWTFSFVNEDNPEFCPKPTRDCYLTWTTDETAAIVRANLHRSPMFSGFIRGTGARYCPSIEDKIVRFPDKERHQIFVEPMGLGTEEYYLQGLSSSLPEDVQERLVRTLPGLERAVIQRSGYAIEYECLDPLQLESSLEVTDVRGLYGAGQINGTSGYEEAAGQGLIAGLNAARACRGLEPLVLGRDEAYLGVLIDDLVTRGTAEPYRMMTARAEYRLSLRQDNADRRLTPIGREYGLVNDADWARFVQRRDLLTAELERLRSTRILPSPERDRIFDQAGSTPPQGGISLAEALARPEIGLDELAQLDALIDKSVDATLAVPADASVSVSVDALVKLPSNLPSSQLSQLNPSQLNPSQSNSLQSNSSQSNSLQSNLPLPNLPSHLRRAAVIEIKYAGYIELEQRRIARFKKDERKRLPADINYGAIRGLRIEAQQKLAAVRPRSLGQAGRISGVSPADLAVLSVWLEMWNREQSSEQRTNTVSIPAPGGQNVELSRNSAGKNEAEVTNK
ncbi:MAG: tRNA uridine-5-carboxymethylaminomethyl(34) synthesis enzyme MnmG [Clostridiaceae bacterium]|nr:tRNA uridine-5-carboxymethylaminomethyl(34) synthesis enzyme MnmG [Clostridiaceae bacterium]